MFKNIAILSLLGGTALASGYGFDFTKCKIKAWSRCENGHSFKDQRFQPKGTVSLHKYKWTNEAKEYDIVYNTKTSLFELQDSEGICLARIPSVLALETLDVKSESLTLHFNPMTKEQPFGLGLNFIASSKLEEAEFPKLEFHNHLKWVWGFMYGTPTYSKYPYRIMYDKSKELFALHNHDNGDVLGSMPATFAFLNLLGKGELVFRDKVDDGSIMVTLPGGKEKTFTFYPGFKDKRTRDYEKDRWGCATDGAMYELKSDWVTYEFVLHNINTETDIKPPISTAVIDDEGKLTLNIDEYNFMYRRRRLFTRLQGECGVKSTSRARRRHEELLASA